MSTTARVAEVKVLYNTVCKFFAVLPPIIGPITLLIDAPFGRFSPINQNSWLLVDGIKSWIAMESVSLLAFGYAFLNSPLSYSRFGRAPPMTINFPPTFLAMLYVIHYLNRAFVSPFRTPSRSKSHIVVPLAAIAFNIVNGSLIGIYLSSPQAKTYLFDSFWTLRFWFGVSLWTAGFVGNIVHDEILLNIRRRAMRRGKAKDEPDYDDNNGKNKGEFYAIPHGGLYKHVSYPNYFCEWMEWLGFAIAAAPLPSLGRLLNTLTPPYLFFLAEVFLMLPRAYKGHKWYHKQFPDYPKDRKVVVPHVF